MGCVTQMTRQISQTGGLSAVLWLLLSSGCGNHQTTRKDGEKFAAPSPPAAFLNDRQARRKNAPPPTRPATPK